MNCKEFTHDLPEYLDRTLRGRRLAAAQEHFDHCPECRLAVQREQAASRAIRHALDRAAGPLSVSTELTEQIMAAAASQTNSTPTRPSAPHAWAWLTAHPFRSMAAGFVIVGALLLRRKFSPPSSEPSFAATDRGSYVVDVPFQTEAHVFALRDGTVVDTVVTTVTESRANFTSSPKPDSSPP
ncbi:MAG TPA: anti-sigma factor [Lacunisphaera sp.]|jgi:hypothetical protein